MPPSTGIAPITKVTGIRREYRDTSDTKRRSRQNYAANSAKRGTKAALNATGSAVQVGGTVVKTTGSTAMRAGAAISGTGVGAVVGVPLMVAGGATYVAGTATKAAGKVMRRSGKHIKVEGDSEKPSMIGKYTVKLLKWISITFIFVWQAILFALFVGAFAIQSTMEEAAKSGLWDKIWGGDFKGAMQQVLTSVAANTLGEQFAVSLAVGAWGFSLAITWFFLFTSLSILLMQKWARVSNIKPLNTSKKELLFMAALVLYAVPGTQVVPWAWFWLRHLQKHGADTE